MIEKKKGGRKKIKGSKTGFFGRWFSLDHMMGKALCILLVVILTVGAFLAPKMINHLYDAGTLMQITYMDMNLSPYAVAYNSFQEKIEAVARAETAGDKLAFLPAEESGEKVSDEELVEIVNREMEAVAERTVMTVWDGWWEEMTKENLISREKNTAYVQPGSGMGDHDPGQEMAPLHFWTLTFELTQEQQNESREAAEREKWVELSQKGIAEWSASRYATQRLMVCLDADFYKIYAIAAEGEREAVTLWYEAHGWEFPQIFGMAPADKNGKYESELPGYGYITEIQMYLTDRLTEEWKGYWEVRPEEEIIHGTERTGEIIGYMRFQDKEAEKGAGGADTAAETGASSEAAAGTAEEMYDAALSDAERESVMYAVEIDVVNEASVGKDTLDTQKEMLLAVGTTGEWSGADNDLWLQKAGCREFFEMMQF